DTDIGRFGLKPSGELTSLQEIRSIAINKSDAPVVIDDIGLKVSRRYEEPEGSSCIFATTNQSASCVIISLTMKKGYNVVELGKEVRERLGILKHSVLPQDLTFGIMTDSPTEVDKSISDFITNLLEGVAAVIFVSILMMSFHASVIMASAIPLSMIASIGVISMLGVTLDQMSIAALIIALVMLVDNGIVVSDNVVRLLHQGVPRLKAAWQGAQEIAVPVLASTLTTIAAFLPMLTIPGSAGEYMAPLPIVISVTLMCSYIIAMTVTPMMCYIMLRPDESDKKLLIGKIVGLFKKKKQAQTKSISQKKDFYTPVINWSLEHKGKVITIGCVILISSFFLAKSIGKTFFPESDRKTFTADIYLPQGATIKQTGKVCQALESAIKKCGIVSNENGKIQQQLVNITTFLGGGGP
ncbi:MAG: efflux RND transporter permease subunit, partial [Victivallaceae bacterium]|nr:efflux RND transporter permease subunit [Victivallaceae bacterium]